MAYSCMLWLVFSPSPSLCSSPCAVLPAPIFGALASSTSFCECFTRLSSSPGHLQILFFWFFLLLFFYLKSWYSLCFSSFSLEEITLQNYFPDFFFKKCIFLHGNPFKSKGKTLVILLMGSEYPFVRIHSIMYLLEYYIQIILFYIHLVAINILVH